MQLYLLLLILITFIIFTVVILCQIPEPPQNCTILQPLHLTNHTCIASEF
jgi:hypothetical protein